MKKILFICYGNICRSAMAEFIMKYLTKEDNYYISSCALSDEEIGNDMYYLAKEKLDEKGIPYTKRKARQITKEDYDNYDLIIGMEDYQIKELKKLLNDEDNKIIKLLDKDIDDPWFTRDFEKAYTDIYEGCKKLLR